jgi:coenzyme F420-reducing hydrogenase alpha subunit
MWIKMKKKIFIIISVIVLIMVAFLAYIFISDMIQEKKLQEEFSYIDGLMENEESQTDEIKEALNRNITKGDYLEVEKSYKQYLKDTFQNMEDITKVLDDENIANILSKENYQKDGPEFINTKKYIEETKKSLEDGKNKYYELLTKDGAMNYINNKDIDDYYKDLFKEEIDKYVEKEEFNDKTVDESLSDVIKLLNTAEKIINLLSENKNSWEIEDDSIVFETQKLSDQYEELTSEI